MSAETLSLFPFAKYINDNIEQQNRHLQKISLTGKINAFGPSENLFEHTDNALKQFLSFKDELIDALVEEQKQKVLGELKLKSQLAIDVLKRNLYERTADVGFLATDDVIVDFLKNGEIDEETMTERLREYVQKYSVYDDVMIFDTDGYLKVNINPKNAIAKSKDPLLSEAIRSDTFVEVYRYSDISPAKKRSLLYAHKIVSGERVLGVLCLSFKFDDELQVIFENLADESILLYLEDKEGVIASSNTRMVPLEQQVMLNKWGDLTLFKKNWIAVTATTKGYQGYYGLDWKSTAVFIADKETESATGHTVQIPKRLDQIIQGARELVEDLGDVIINGELIASKYRQYYISPILDNLRQISTTMLEKINESATNLAALNTQALYKNAMIATAFSIDLMDRNLYERANDCRWWALTPQFIEALGSDTPDTGEMHEILMSINSLYTVYTNLFIFDKSGTIVTASQDSSIVGKQVSDGAVAQVLQNRDSQRYFVSDFEKTPFYRNDPTYIYYASIVNGNETVGGIGIVFDAAVEFSAILNDSMLQEHTGFSLFCMQDGTVIASSDRRIKPLERVDLAALEITLEPGKTIQKFVRYHDRSYLLSVAPSQGYREYKRSDHYRNDVFVLYFVEGDF